MPTLTPEQKKAEAVQLVKSVWHNDIATFKQDYETIQKGRIVQAVQDYKNKYVADTISKLTPVPATVPEVEEPK